MKISGTTKITGLFGYPVEHSLSPAMHNAAFEYLGLDYCYITFPVRPDSLGEAVRAIRALDLKGVNVTIPHKENVIGLLDAVHEEASFIGAVNTIENRDGRLTGYNTDGRGFMGSLSEAGITVEGKRVLIIGAGGACRAISYYLSQKADGVAIFDIDEAKVGRLVGDLGNIRANVRVCKSLDRLEGIDIVINATPLGLKETDPLPLHADLITEKMVICDVIYKKTPLLKAASLKGCKTLDGLGMLLHQGVLAFEIWTGIKPPVAIMRNAIMGFKR
ncbi:MAG TPA: shikimate dehydrogenase [Thermodesulfovibrionales bacterium]|jgi:shikimate dehydrogenase|nr:shikimate dehydrogenase [Thermodesulfovibrionales bacterium]